jgi:serine acetyltransferase/acyl carrier protein
VYGWYASCDFEVRERIEPKDTVFEYILADIYELTRNEPGLLTKLGAVFLNPGLQAVMLYRIARWLHLNHLGPLAVLTTYIGSVVTGAQISARARVGKGLVIYHPHGIVIGATAVIGDYCTLVHGNVIGQLYGGGDRPVIGHHFVAGSGAKMLGRIRIGNKVRVAPNSVVTQSLPDGLTVAGNPVRIIRDRRVPAADAPAPAEVQGRAGGAHTAVVGRLVEVIANSATVVTKSNGAIGENTLLLGEGIGLDSIEMLHLISAVEEEFGLTLDERDLRMWNLQTVGSLAAFIEMRLAQ